MHNILFFVNDGGNNIYRWSTVSVFLISNLQWRDFVKTNGNIFDPNKLYRILLYIKVQDGCLDVQKIRLATIAGTVFVALFASNTSIIFFKLGSIISSFKTKPKMPAFKLRFLISTSMIYHKVIVPFRFYNALKTFRDILQWNKLNSWLLESLQA